MIKGLDRIRAWAYVGKSESALAAGLSNYS